MAVLLLYTLQLAVNTVKAVSPPTHPLCMSMFLSLCSQVHCFARWPHPEPGPKWRGARKGSHMEHQIQDSSLFLQMGFFIFFPYCLLNVRGSSESWNCPRCGCRALISPPLDRG